MKAILIKAKARQILGQWFASKATIKAVEIENELKAYYKALGCGYIEIQYRKVKGKEYAFICDEEAFCKSTPAQLSVNCSKDSRFNLVNSVLVCNRKEGTALSEEDVKNILSAFKNNALQID